MFPFFLALLASAVTPDDCFHKLLSSDASFPAYTTVFAGEGYDLPTAKGLADAVIHSRISYYAACHYREKETGENQYAPKAYA